MLTLASIGEVTQISVNEVAMATGLTKKTAKTHLAALVGEGWLIVSRPSVAEIQHGASLTYRLTVPVETLHGGGGGVIITPPLGESLPHPWGNHYPSYQQLPHGIYARTAQCC